METHEFEEKIATFVRKNGLLPDNGRVLVTLSGGADSVSLLFVLRRLGYECVAVHCNFHLRGEESMRDERFVRDLCRRLPVECVTRDFDVPSYAAAHGVSVEMACRELRYAWFEEMRAVHDCSCIAVAHHRDDNQETFFLNLLRGSGIAGLAGIKPRNGDIVRPLLCVGRADVEAYLQALKERYIVDSTNSRNEYKRNKIRNVVLPTVRKEFPHADVGIQRTLHDVQACNELYQYMLAGLLADVVECRADGARAISLDKLSPMKSGGETLLFEFLKDFGFNSAQVSELWSAVGSACATGKKIISSTHVASFNRGGIEVAPATETRDEEFEVDFTAAEQHLPIDLKWETVERSGNSFQRVDGRNAVALGMPILSAVHRVALRHWRKGDRFKPFGMNGSKLVSDLFADAKLSERQKHEVWLLTADGDIVWVVGIRSSSLFAVNPCDTAYLRVSVDR